MKDLAEVLGDASRSVRALTFTCNALSHLGHTEDAVRIGKCGVELSGALGDPTSEMEARSHLGQAQWNLGAYMEAAENLRRSIAALRRESDRTRFGYSSPFSSVLYRHFLVECLTELGDFDEATAVSKEAVRIAEALDNP
jgi:hypothetical protein